GSSRFDPRIADQELKRDVAGTNGLAFPFVRVCREINVRRVIGHEALPDVARRSSLDRIEIRQFESVRTRTGIEHGSNRRVRPRGDFIEVDSALDIAVQAVSYRNLCDEPNVAVLFLAFARERESHEVALHFLETLVIPVA